MSNTWMEGIPAAITICDAEGIIIEMNARAGEVFQDQGGLGLIGSNLFDCHPEAARRKLDRLIQERRPNVYSIEKKGQKKLIYQCPWYQDGRFAGLVELALDMPAEVPHFIRD